MTKAEQIRAAEFVLRVGKPVVRAMGRLAHVCMGFTCLYDDLEDWVEDNK